MTKLPDDAVAKLKELAAALDRKPGDPPSTDLLKAAFPVIKRKFTQELMASPLRIGIDYHSSARKVFVFCEVCGGIVDSSYEHVDDPDACEREKVRQIMEL